MSNTMLKILDLQCYLKSNPTKLTMNAKEKDAYSNAIHPNASCPYIRYSIVCYHPKYDANSSMTNP